jgi:hypothetical protein
MHFLAKVLIKMQHFDLDENNSSKLDWTFFFCLIILLN